jgi:F0F1-type ATP synthase membrane subunit c/vacuolar-type H+-ATPase subunit K
MNPIVSGASVIAAGLAIGLAAIGPVLVKVQLLLRLLKV